MAGSNRWTTSSGSTAQASTGPINVPDDDRYESEDSQHQIPEGGLILGAGKSHQMIREHQILFPRKTTWNIMEYGFSFRQECQWHEDKEFARLSRKREIQSLQGPSNISGFCLTQMAMDSVS